MEKDDENKRLHLKMIEDVISRMGSNSFLIKGWSITAIGGLITLYVAKIQYSWSYDLLWVALVLCLIFWISDAYYLQKERQYRQLYDLVRQRKNAEIDFSMHVSKLNENILCCMCRPIFLFSYIPLFLVLIVILYIDKP
ncbi:hypothetical protein L2724_08915 [Limosilactobacillus vaginalis]|uniref:Uncharacterized protein n=1 Tax=Limosilactobacillus vaginalis TaxID=1633 RepID=A0AAW5WVF7_9LACO|nr:MULTISPECIES: hypothetical protein [Limosilactobacillus]MCZ3668365.1 hypothetical protein [Limosilactobacillus vaginalis]